MLLVTSLASTPYYFSKLFQLVIHNYLLIVHVRRDVCNVDSLMIHGGPRRRDHLLNLCVLRIRYMLTVRRHVYPHVSTHRVNLGVISYKLAHANLAASAQQVCLHVQSAGMRSLCD